LSYGGIGVVIGHELTHGFDDKGRLFDKDGNLNKWWSDFSIKHFHEKTKCLIQQYNQYTLADIGQSIDGETTQGK
jgi:predicted metalloendopeptidase